MVPFKFGGLRVRHDSTFEVDIVPFLNYNSKSGKSNLLCLVQLFDWMNYIETRMRSRYRSISA